MSTGTRVFVKDVTAGMVTRIAGKTVKVIDVTFVALYGKYRVTHTGGTHYFTGRNSLWISA